MLKVDFSEDIRSYLGQLKDASIKDISQDTLNAIILGQKAIGKTQMICESARRPVLIHSFDPGGTKHMKPEIERGEVIVDSRFEFDDARKPTAYDLWEKEFDKMLKMNFFEHVGTYVIDSFTHWLRSMYHKVAKTKFANDGVLEIKGWAIITNALQSMTRLGTALPCDFLLTGHLTRDKEEFTGRFMELFAAPPSCQVTIPSLFDEYYVMRLDPKDDGRRVLQTANTSTAVAGARVGRGKFSLYEEPDLRKLKEKAGLDITDRPYPLFERD